MYLCVCTTPLPHCTGEKKAESVCCFVGVWGGGFSLFRTPPHPVDFRCGFYLRVSTNATGWLYLISFAFFNHTHPRFHPLLFDSLLPCNECAGSELNAQQIVTNPLGGYTAHTHTNTSVCCFFSSSFPFFAPSDLLHLSYPEAIIFVVVFLPRFLCATPLLRCCCYCTRVGKANEAICVILVEIKLLPNCLAVMYKITRETHKHNPPPHCKTRDCDYLSFFCTKKHHVILRPFFSSTTNVKQRRSCDV